VRHEKIKVLRTVLPPAPEDVIFGQYTSGTAQGEKVPGYMDADGVAPGSTTETFVALRLRLDNWRWKGVPFYLRTGKRMPAKQSQVVIKFRPAPISLFETMGAEDVRDNLLVLRLQPDEGFGLYFNVKTPGSPFEIRQMPLAFSYGDVFEGLPDAYETLLLDILAGDQTLFVHSDEVEASWRLYDRLLTSPPFPKPYFAGTWGPDDARRLGLSEALKGHTS